MGIKSISRPKLSCLNVRHLPAGRLRHRHSSPSRSILPLDGAFSPRWRPSGAPTPGTTTPIRLGGAVLGGWGPSTHAVRPIIRSNACSTRLTATAGTYFVRACRPRRRVPPGLGSLQQGVVVLHAKWLGRARAQCPKFFTAATRRCLSGFQSQCGQSPSRGWQSIIGLVGLDPTNNLILEKPIPPRQGLWVWRIPPGCCLLRGVDSSRVRTRTPWSSGLHSTCMCKTLCQRSLRAMVKLILPVHR